MEGSPTRLADDAETVVRTYGDTLFRLCLVMLSSDADAEDAVQETIMKYLRKAPCFEEPSHQKAWLITVAKNECRDMLRARRRHPQLSLTCLEDVSFDAADSGILDALMSLPEKYRLVLVLYYVEEYRIEDIARIIDRSPSAVKMRLQKGRKLLDEKYRKEYL